MDETHQARDVRACIVALAPFLGAQIGAALFGAATPLSKVLLGDLAPAQLAGLLYLGAAAGHQHEAVAHTHPHWPDLHHRHRHS